MRYIERPYAERRFFMIVDDDRGTDNEMIDVFQRTHIPAGLTFGSEGYMKNTLYVAHPASVGLYVPYERHERIFIEHKMHELAYLCQALGATELKITRIKGLNIDQSMKTSFSAGADASFAGKFGAQADYSSSSNRHESTTNASSISISVKSDAMLLPFVPDDLMWYKFEPTWKQMVSQRKVGALEYTLEISSKDHTDLSTSQSESLKASMKILLFKVSGSYNSSVEEMLSRKEETIWRVSVKFRPMSDYKIPQGTSHQGSQHINSSESSKAVDDYRQSCLKLINGRRVPDVVQIELNRLRSQLNINADIACKIEDEVKAQFKKGFFSRFFGSR